MVMQLRMWYFITIKEFLSINAHFLVPCSDTPEAHVTTFARQLDWHQVDCKYHGVTVTKNNKVYHFMTQMYACGLFEYKYLDN